MALLGIWHPARVSPALMLYDILVGFGGKKKKEEEPTTQVLFLLKIF